MPRGRPKIDDFWRQKAFAIFRDEPKLGRDAIEERFENEGTVIGRDDWPSASTIHRWKTKDWPRVPEKQQRQYGHFYWPESMGTSELPWEASPAALELLAARLPNWARPTIRLVKWFYRCTMAAPDADFKHRLRAATALASSEALGQASSQDYRNVEAFLAFAPWRSDEHKARYEKAVPQESNAQLLPITIPAGTDVDLVIDMLGDMSGSTFPGSAREVLKDVLTRRHKKEAKEADNG